jgi:ATP-dependent Clp protease ATP-binding subunit ClpC
MFERFDAPARRVLILAVEEARMRSDNFVGPEHLLLGLIDEEGAAAGVLESLGLTAEAVRDRVDQVFGPRSSSVVTGSPPFTSSAKKALEMARWEPSHLHHRYVGTEHILLGLVDAEPSVATQVLASLGVDSDQVREKVIEQLVANREDFTPPNATRG